MNWNQEAAEEEKPLTQEEVRQGLAHLFGKDIIDPAESDQDQGNDSETPAPEINFPELENRCPALSLQQIKPVENRWETGCSPSDTRLPSEPKRGPRGVLSELPQPTQQRILEMLENRSRAALAETLSKPVPEGIGFRVTARMLERFENRHGAMEQRAEIQALAAAARQLIDDPGSSADAALTNATLRIIRASVLEYANDIQNFATLERLNNVLHKLRRADQADRRQAYLERSKVGRPANAAIPTALSNAQPAQSNQ